MKIESGRYYHIYNRGINSQEIFFNDKDFNRFLDKYNYYLGLSLETLAYCLMSNHFRFLVKVISEKEQQATISNHDKFNSSQKYYILPNPNKLTFKVENLLSHLLNSHTKYINSKYKRSGSLWDGNFRIKMIDTDEYLQQCICYIHRNPIHHGLTNFYKAYPYSSFNEVLNNQSIIINPSVTLDIFGSRDNYLVAHQEAKAFPESYRLE